MNDWITEYIPKIGDYGRLMECDAQVVDVSEQFETVTIEIFDYEDSQFITVPYVYGVECNYIIGY